MEVSYALGERGTEKVFERDYCHLYYAIARLRDLLTVYWITGKIHGIVSVNRPIEDAPQFAAAAFDDGKAAAYESFMEDYFSKKSSVRDMRLPRPKFGVKITVRYLYGNDEEEVFAFDRYGDELVERFCKKVTARAKYFWRCNFLLNTRK